MTRSIGKERRQPSAREEADDGIGDRKPEPFRASLGVKVAGAVGQKFEFRARPDRAGELLPDGAAGDSAEAAAEERRHQERFDPKLGVKAAGAVGQKFQFAARPTGPGELLPAAEEVKPEPAMRATTENSTSAEAAPAPAPTRGVFGSILGGLGRLFRRRR
ncbi:MAG: hypothetical protein AB1714_15290 [Acidobacteriota bacterium]